MKLRFFLTSTAVLFFTVIVVSVLYLYSFKTERMRLIDQQVETVATSLLASDIAEGEFEEMSDIVADAIGSEAATTLVSIYNENGGLLYRNDNALLIFGDDALPLVPQKQELKAGTHRARILNLKIPPSKNILQVGLLLDRGQIQWQSMHLAALRYIVLLMVIVTIASVVLSTLLMRPLRSLAEYLRYVSDNVGVTNVDLGLPLSLQGARRNDEFGQLLGRVRELTHKLQTRFMISQVTASQMAHELKTPLTVLKNSLESIQLNPQIEKNNFLDAKVQEAINETDHLSRVISGFMDWSRVEHGSIAGENIFAIHLATMIPDVSEKLNRLYAQRIQVEKLEPETIFANAELARQVFQNLLMNALKYSPPGSPVLVGVKNKSLEIQDSGPGLPASVLEKLGQPFNVGPSLVETPLSDRGSGLGLAWVSTISKRYGWKLEFEFRSGTIARIIFE